MRTFISVNGVEWTPDSVCVFDGLQNALERCVNWYEDHLSAEKAGELLREDLHSDSHHPVSVESNGVNIERAIPLLQEIPVAMPDGIRIFEAEPITDRKSAFVGRACAISDPSEVNAPLRGALSFFSFTVFKIPLILSHLLSDRRIARAAHPVINAWRCEIGTVMHQGGLLA